MSDDRCRAAIRKSKNLMVPWYLMSSYLYYCKDISLLSDGLYDKLCADMIEAWPEITHRHKHLIDLEALKAGTGFQLREDDYPQIVKCAAARLA